MWMVSPSVTPAPQATVGLLSRRPLSAAVVAQNARHTAPRARTANRVFIKLASLLIPRAGG